MVRIWEVRPVIRKTWILEKQFEVVGGKRSCEELPCGVTDLYFSSGPRRR